MKRLSVDARHMEAVLRLSRMMTDLVSRYGEWNAAKIGHEVEKMLKARRIERAKTWD